MRQAWWLGMRRWLALAMLLVGLGQWLLPTMLGAPQRPPHAAYCACRNCPGEPFCCCRPDPSLARRMALRALCDSDPTKIVAFVLKVPLALPLLIALFPLPTAWAWQLLPDPPLPSKAPEKPFHPPRRP